MNMTLILSCNVISESFIYMLFPGILQPKTLATLKEQNAAPKTIFVGNLSHEVEQADVYVYF